MIMQAFIISNAAGLAGFTIIALSLWAASRVCKAIANRRACAHINKVLHALGF
jgi:hypothetical protein